MKFQKVTPNLVVADLAKSLEFYRDVLGFNLSRTVPDQAPFVFAWMQRDGVDVFLNDRETVRKEQPALASTGGAGFYIIVDEIDSYYEAVRGKANVVMPIADQFYGMREFIVTDPDISMVVRNDGIHNGQT